MYLLTAIGLTPGGSSTVHIYTQTIHRITQWNRILRTEHTFYLFIYVVYSQHAPLPSVILHALPDRLHTVLLVTYRIYIPYVWFSCSYV